MEIELKFQLPLESKASLEKFIKSKGGTSKRLEPSTLTPMHGC